MSANPEIRIYEPDESVKKGSFCVFSEIFREICSNKWLTYQLFKRDFLASYKQSFVGVFWAFIMPLMSVGVFVILNNSGVFSLGSLSVPYAVYAVLGLAFWQIFSVGIMASSNAIVNSGVMITKINFSKKSLVFASMGQALISFLVQFFLLCVLLWVYRYIPSYYILIVPVLAVPIILFTLGLGLMLSLLNAVFRDIANMLSLLITFLMFLTPILYAKASEGILGVITAYNPLFYLISYPRDLVLTARGELFGGYILTSLASAVFFLLCIKAFHITEKKIAERI